MGVLRRAVRSSENSDASDRPSVGGFVQIFLEVRAARSGVTFASISRPRFLLLFAAIKRLAIHWQCQELQSMAQLIDLLRLLSREQQRL